jgi:hypothetical protein
MPSDCNDPSLPHAGRKWDWGLRGSGGVLDPAVCVDDVQYDGADSVFCRGLILSVSLRTSMSIVLLDIESLFN